MMLSNIFHFRVSVVKVGLNGPAELIFEQDVGRTVEFKMFFQGLHIGSDHRLQILLSWQALDGVGLVDTCNVLRLLSWIVHDSANFSTELNHGQVNLHNTLQSRQSFDLSLTGLRREETNIELIEGFLGDLLSGK